MTTKAQRPWPVEGGRMGQRIREKDWTQTSLGATEQWPERLKGMVELLLGSPVPMTLLWGADLVQIYNDGYRDIMEPGRPEHLGRRASESWPEIWNRLGRICEQVLVGEALRPAGHADVVSRCGTVEDIWLGAAFSPVRNEAGGIAGLVATFADGRAARPQPQGGDVQEVHPPSPPREDSPQLVWRAAEDGARIWSSPHWGSYTGQSQRESLGSGWSEAIHPEDREAVLAAWRDAACETEPSEVELDVGHRLFCAAERRYRWFRSQAIPIHDDGGRLVEWLGTTTGVDDLERLREEQRALSAELQHRVRNMLAVIRSVTRRTAETSRSVEDYALHLDGRIGSFARTQTKLMRTSDMAIDLEELICDELASHAAFQDDQVRLRGPALRVRAKLAESLGIAFHELAANAVKFGALAVPEGRIDIRWAVRRQAGDDRAAVLELIWQEGGCGPIPSKPRRRGFGTAVIKDTLPYEFNASTTLDFLSDGIRCIIAIPLTARIICGYDSLIVEDE